MFKEKRWCIVTISAFWILLLAIVGVVVVIDPFFHYHRPLEGVEYQIQSEAYQNAGIAKNFEYESMITGSSMVQNFRPSYFENEEVMKLSFSNAYPKTGDMIIRYCIKEKPNLKRVYWGLDIFNYITLVETYGQDIPTYLYDDKVTNDLSYLLNKDVLLDWITPVLLSEKKEETSIDLEEAFCWDKSFVFSETQCLKFFSNGKNRAGISSETKEKQLLTCKENLEKYIMPVIIENPTVEFKIFYPPYSILFWQSTEDTLEHYVAIEKYVTKSLLEYPNVKIYNFQNETQYIENLFYYKDTLHYNSDVNKFMAQAMQKDECRITWDNYEECLEEIIEIAKEFDYNIFESEGELRGICDLTSYVQKVVSERDRYVLFCSQNTTPNADVQTILCELNISEDAFTNEKNGMWIIAGSDIQYKDYDDRDELIESTEDFKVLSNGNGIWINDVRYAQDNSMMSIIVFDRDRQRVVDSIKIDGVSGCITRQ